MKIGIVGNGGIVQQALVSFKQNKIEVTALWCRNEEKGKPLCDAFEIKKQFTDYDAFLKEESFDTVYIGLSNSLHYEYAKKSIEAGKHTIVEKPFVSTYQQAKELVDLAKEKDIYLFEAIMSRYTRNFEALISAFDEIGEIKLVNCNYAQYSRRYDAYLQGNVLPAFDPKMAGGALYDINVYCLHFVVGLFGKPRSSIYSAVKGPNGIDTSGVVLLDYGNFKAVCSGAKDSSSKNFMMIQGTKGYIEIPNRPGFVKNISLHKGEQQRILDVEDLEDPMGIEWKRIQEVLDKKDKQTEEKWLDQSLDVMSILEKSRKDIGLVFPGDSQEDCDKNLQ